MRTGIHSRHDTQVFGRRAGKFPLAVCGRVGRIAAYESQVDGAAFQGLHVVGGAVGGAQIHFDLAVCAADEISDGLSDRVHGSAAVGRPDGEDTELSGIFLRRAVLPGGNGRTGA